jgi:nifR3 family TIM-barrel protein
MQTFWDKLPKPFFVLAPLANVTDAAFRQVIAKYSKPVGPDVFWTEFVSADGLVKGNKEVLLRDLIFTEAERPIVAQFFTSTPEMMEKAAALARELGFDGVDINTGCPDKSIEKQGAGAKMIQNPARTVECILAAKQGAGPLPISIKTRLGYNKDILEEWLPVLLKTEPAAVTLHARTRKEMSAVPARWERVQRAVEIRDELQKGKPTKTLIIGNGDLRDITDARQKIAMSGADGAMLGRAIFGRPWLFANDTSNETFSLERRLRIAVEHTKLFEELLGDIKSFALMKKHFKAYVEGFPGAKELRIQLMEAENAKEVETLVEEFLQKEVY